MGYGHTMDKMNTNIDYNIFIFISWNLGINRTQILLDKRNKRNIYIDRQNEHRVQSNEHRIVQRKITIDKN